MRSDAELLDAWRGDDRDAGEELFTRYYPLLLRFFANKIAGDPTDLIQETFLGCVAGQERLRNGRSFRSYLFSIAYHKLRDHYRNQRIDGRRFDPSSETAADLSPGPSTMMGENAQQQLLLHALRRIPLEHQVVLELFYWEGFTSNRIAELMEEPSPTIRTRIRRARQLLTTALQDSEADPRVLEETLTDLDGWAAKIRAAHAGAMS